MNAPQEKITTSEKEAYELPDPERPASEPTAVLEYEPKAEAHDPYAALRYRDYRLYSLGWMISVIGQQMQSTAMGWEIYDRTKSQLALGFVAGIQAVPLLALALPAGKMADTFDRRRIITISSFLAAMCSAGLAVMSYRPGSVPWMLVLLGLSSAFLMLGRPARASLMPLIVPQKVFPNAVTWNSTIFQVSVMSGPALGGLLLIHSARLAYAADAMCAAAFATLMLMVRPAFKPQDSGPVDRSLLAGLRFVFRSRMILATITLDMFAVLLGGAVYILPAFTRDILKTGPTGLGWLRAADAVGAFSMSLIVAHMPPMKRAGRNLLLAVAGFGLATIVFGLSRNFWLSFAALVFLGAMDNISVVVRHTLVQVLTPDAMRGRVSAVNQIFIGASNEIGGLESGLAAAGFTALATWYGVAGERAGAFGTSASVVFGGIGTILVVLTVALVWPQIRRIGSLQDVKAEE